jgi:predicted RNase H-like HicB family nuclease
VIDAQRYPAQVFYSDEDEGFIAVATDLPGCSAFGDTQEEAVAELRDAIDAWKMAAENAGNPIPEPSKLHLDDLPSGKILLRLPRTLHAQLIERAKYENVSLNQHLVFVLTASTSSTFVRNAILDHREVVWSHFSAMNMVTLNYSGDSGVIIFDTPTPSRWYQSSTAKMYPALRLLGHSSIEEAAHG